MEGSIVESIKTRFPNKIPITISMANKAQKGILVDPDWKIYQIKEKIQRAYGVFSVPANQDIIRINGFIVEHQSIFADHLKMYTNKYSIIVHYGPLPIVIPGKTEEQKCAEACGWTTLFLIIGFITVIMAIQ